MNPYGNRHDCSRGLTGSSSRKIGRAGYKGTKRVLKVFAALMLGLVLAYPGFAQANPEELNALLGSVSGAKTVATPRHTLSADGYVRSLSSGPEGAFVSPLKQKADAESVAVAFVSKHAGLFGAIGADTQFTLHSKGMSSADTVVHLQQVIGGVPVYNGRMVVQVDPNGGVRSVLSDILRGSTPFDTDKGLLKPTLTTDAAKAVAFKLGQKKELKPDELEVQSEPVLVIFAPVVVGRTGKPVLAWQMEIASKTEAVFKERVIVDAHSGRIVYHFSLIHEAKNRQVYDSNNTTADPGTLRRSEGQGASGITEVDNAYEFLGDTYDFYSTEHGRDSINGLGMALIATVRYCESAEFCPYSNAFWNGETMHFGDGFATDDVTAHELTHGVTQYESNLDYFDESGAINESFSDIWGEFIDLTNGAGNDSASVRWLMGEDISGGPIRDMANPTVYGDPDRYYSPLFHAGADVHINSGVGNKLCYLLTDGDDFNGRTVIPLGISKTADLFYEAQANLLTSSSDYADLYTQLTQAAINIGLTLSERNSVERACRAVEIGGLPEGVSDFKANSSSGNPNITITWTNPSSPATIKVVRKSGSYSSSPSDGTVIYSGTGTSCVDGPYAQGTTYYYTAYAYYGLDEFSEESYSPPSRSRATTGIQKPDTYFAEFFEYGDNDLDNTMITFTPIGTGDFYATCSQSASVFPVDASTMTWTSMADDDYRLVALTGGKTVSLYGQAYSSVYIGSNGNLTFLGPDIGYIDNLDNHFSQPRVSGLFNDFMPDLYGNVGYRQMADRLVVTYLWVPDFWMGGYTTFQIEMFFDGKIRFTYLGVDAIFGVVGLSSGDWDAYTFEETDMTDSAGCSVDHDSDGIPDYIEGNGDSDNDSIGNFEDSDSDGDGINDSVESATDTDHDGTPNYLDLDSDGDGLSDEDESLAPADVDGDSIPNYIDTDSDGDGIDDFVEVAFNTDPYNANDVPDVPLPYAGLALALLVTGVLTIRVHVRRRREV
ncbi:MAG: M4 family metallopeptidase [Candidatus Hydrogenedentes bacterium]|nr:M4 family metallopeptidase [Candidatus Hydrogenedentota bacterium]